MVLHGRRQFLGGLFAAGLIPKPTWADAGAPAFLSAAARPDGQFVLCGMDTALNLLFQLPLPDRGHAAAAHPTRPEAVAFARRPGTFAVVLDCRQGRHIATLTAPPGRHFYGHGAFSMDGSRLYTTENDFEAGRGRIGVWNAARDYARIGEWDSGGIGPHDIKRLPGRETLVVANGGIDTHPDTGRTKLNIPTMQPNLAYIEDGAVFETAELMGAQRKNSIRHLAVSAGGKVAFGMQWQGDGQPTHLVGTHNLGQPLALVQTPVATLRKMGGYVGSVAFSTDGLRFGATSPRGGEVQIYDTQTLTVLSGQTIQDASGIAGHGGGFVATSGLGSINCIGTGDQRPITHAPLMFDNHLIGLP